MRAITMAVAMRSRVHDLAVGWQRRGHDLGFGAGVGQGYATLGRIGFEGRYDYAAVGSVTNVAARLCARAADEQILVTQRVFSATHIVLSDPCGELELPGLARPVRAFNISGLREPTA